MKKVFLSVFSVIGAVCLMTGCSGGGSASSVSDDGMFGSLPQVTAEYKDKAMQVIQELSKLTDASKKDEFVAKVKAMEEEANKAFDAELAKLKGKEFATEVGKGVPYKVVKPFAIDEQGKKEFGVVYLVGVVETTVGLIGYDNRDGFRSHSVAVAAADGDGKPLTLLSTHLSYSDFEASAPFKAAGTKAFARLKFEAEPWNLDALGKAEKISLILDESEDYKQLREADKNAKKAFEEKMTEMLKKDETKK